MLLFQTQQVKFFTVAVMSDRIFVFVLGWRKAKQENSQMITVSCKHRKNVQEYSGDNKRKFTQCRYLIRGQMLGATAQPEANFNLHRSRLSPQCLLLISELLIEEGWEPNNWKRGGLEGYRKDTRRWRDLDTSAAAISVVYQRDGQHTPTAVPACNRLFWQRGACVLRCLSRVPAGPDQRCDDTRVFWQISSSL